MLEIRPVCENCKVALPPNSIEAMICSFECTFCRTCAEFVLHNVCPNCGGGFARRPIRPAKNWKGFNFLGAYPASRSIKYQPVNASHHLQFADSIKLILPEWR